MKNQVMVITGASHGIGLATAHEAARRGASLLLTARHEDQLKQACEDVRGAGGRAEYCVADVSRSEPVRELFAQCERLFGRLDVLFNNAGVGQFVPALLTTDEIWDETVDANLRGAFLCIREALPLFEKSGGGLIINNASIAAVRGFPNFSAYCASKAGLLGLTRALREELRDKKIRVAAILPGATDTPFWDHVAGEWNRSLMIKPEAVARLVAEMAEAPPESIIEELTVMPAGGAL